jgi:hypothetical protein
MATDKHTVITRPLARSGRLVVETVGDEAVIFDLDTRTSHALKPLAAAVFAYADGKNTAAEIAELASYRLATTVTEAEVASAITQLDEKALLDSPQLELEDSRGGISRRDALKAFAAVGAGAVLISSVAAPAALAATSAQQTELGDDQLCATGTATSVTYTEGSNPLPSGIVVPGANVGTNTSSSYESDIFPAPGVTSVTVKKGTTTVDTFTSLNSGSGWTGNAPNNDVKYNGTCSYLSYSSSAKTYSKVTGSWQCIPCDGTDGYQCCSVVCGPIVSSEPALGYDWGSGAVAPVGYPYPYTGCGAESTSGCPSPGDPDYTTLGYHGKFCTDDGGKPKS